MTQEANKKKCANFIKNKDNTKKTKDKIKRKYIFMTILLLHEAFRQRILYRNPKVTFTNEI